MKNKIIKFIGTNISVIALLGQIRISSDVTPPVEQVTCIVTLFEGVVVVRANCSETMNPI